MLTRHRVGRLRKAALVFFGLFVAYRLFVFVYNYNSPFTWGVSWVGSIIVHELVSAERADRQGDDAYWVEVLSESDIAAFHRPALGDSEGVLNGRLLPAALYHPDSLPDPIFRVNMGEKLLFDGTIVVRNTRELYHFRRVHTAIYELMALESPRLVIWLAGRSDTLPPTRLDVLIYYSLEGPPNVSPESPFWEQTRDDWRRMSRGSNPLYRLIALHSAHHWCESVAELTDTYDSAFGEANSLFHWTALHFMEAVARQRSDTRQNYHAFHDVSEDEARALFRDGWSELVNEFQRTHAGYDDGTVGGWFVYQDVQKTLQAFGQTGNSG